MAGKKLLLALTIAIAACTGSIGGGEGSSSQACAGDEEYFEKNVWKPILSVKCVGCHNAEGPAKHTRMVLVPPTVADAAHQNYPIVRAIADEKLGDQSILLLRPTGKYPEGHGGGTLITEGTSQFAALATFVKRGTGTCEDGPGSSCNVDTVTVGGRVLRRLTRREYDATIHDLFGIESTWGSSLPADGVVNGFENNAAALRVSGLFADKARVAAEEISELAKVDTKCTDGACFVAEFGARAFRRPLTDGEVSRYAALYASPDGGAKLVITAMLQSPHFLYRPELGAPSESGKVELGSYELASELSYFLWGSMPDDALFAKAKDGSLTTPAVLESEARRMLKSDRSRALIERFVGGWLDVDRIDTIPKDPVTYADFTAAARASLKKESIDFFDGAVHGGTFGDRFSATAGDRAGLLELRAILATHATPASSSPVHRGKLVRERFLCQKLSPPPPGLNVQLPPFDPTKTTRERFSGHSANQPCNGCHRLMDPIGFGFEAFDGVGNLRKDDNGHPLDLSGEIVGSNSTDGTFVGTRELSSMLASSADVQSCFALQWWRYARGAEETAEEQCGVDKITEAFKGKGLRIDELILTVILEQGFHTRIDDGTAAATVPPSAPPVSSDAGMSTDSAPPPASDLDVSVKTDSTWATGYCDSVTVTNKTASSIDWSTKLPADGTISTKWNVTVTTEGTSFVFRGDASNASLAAGASTSFGFCVTKP
ncbi:MAG: DUF1592 domain-containing protein [Polyangiales bacterium]